MARYVEHDKVQDALRCFSLKLPPPNHGGSEREPMTASGSVSDLSTKQQPCSRMQNVPPFNRRGGHHGCNYHASFASGVEQR